MRHPHDPATMHCPTPRSQAPGIKPGIKRLGAPCLSWLNRSRVANASVATLASLMLLSACASQSTSVASAPHNQSTKATETSSQSPRTKGAVVSATLERQPLSANTDEFIAQVAERYDLPTTHVANLLASAKVNPQTQRLMTPRQGTVRRSWTTYRQRVMDPIRIRKGKAFNQRNATALREAEQRYGVPAEIISSIIGVETIYGDYMGTFSLLDALYTLGFHHPDPKRPERHLSFRNQLAALIALDHQGKINARTEQGSFAGATGLPQFMPLSLMHYAVDGDGDGRINLRDSEVDAIHSVANFLVQHGWQRNMPVFAPASLPNNPAAVVQHGLEPTVSWQDLQRLGAQSNVGNRSQPAKWQEGQVLGVINLIDEGVRDEYRIATQNFFVLTKYNNSYFYAASVADFAGALRP